MSGPKFSPAAFSATGFAVAPEHPAGAAMYARMMVALLPPGRLWRTIGSTLYDVFLGCADELARVHERSADLLSESVPSTAIELLPEYERELGIAAADTTAERQANIVARLVARQRFRPVDIQTALAPLLAQDADDVVVLERSAAFAASVEDPREIFMWFVFRDPTLGGTYFLASAQSLIDRIKPSHTTGVIVESIDALYDDAHSLYDRDLLGA